MFPTGWKSTQANNTNPVQTLRPAHTGCVTTQKKWLSPPLFNYLRSAAPAAPCVNTLTDNSGFHLLHFVTQTLPCTLCALCGPGVWEGDPENACNFTFLAPDGVLRIKNDNQN